MFEKFLEEVLNLDGKMYSAHGEEFVYNNKEEIAGNLKNLIIYGEYSLILLKNNQLHIRLY